MKVTDLETHFPFQRTFWKVQRFGWLGLFALLILSIAGFTGDGPFNQKDINSYSGRVRHDTFAKKLNPTEFIITSHDRNQVGISIQIDKSIIDNYKIIEILPEPVTVDDVAHSYRFNFNALGQSDIIFRVEPQDFGVTKGKIIQNDETVQITQFIYP